MASSLGVARSSPKLGLPHTSVVFETPNASFSGAKRPALPAYFTDLHLDQVISLILKGREEYDLVPLFCSPLHSAAAVRYRQEVSLDLDERGVASYVRCFAERMRRVRSFLRGMGQVTGRHYEQGWFLDAAQDYCDAVNGLLGGLRNIPLESRALQRLRDYLSAYVASEAFLPLETKLRELRRQLADVRYSMLIRGTRVSVWPFGGEPDYSSEIEQTFAKFRQGAAEDFLSEFRDLRDANHVHAQVLERVAKLYPDVFARMEACYTQYRDFLDPTVVAFDREVQFYLAYLEFTQHLRDAGLPFCYPEVSDCSKETHVEQAFDIALASALARQGSAVVCNDIDLAGPERVLVVTGPNQGGKTTFARMFGQLHFLAGLGLPVPAQRARLFLPDRIFSHFEREERLDAMHGKLYDELVRARDALAKATANSLLVLNEGFSSTTLSDSLFIGAKVLGRVTKLGALCVYVTFVDELASLNEATVSMVADVVPADPDVRTYKVSRRPADGRAYAKALARKYGLSYAALRQAVG